MYRNLSEVFDSLSSPDKALVRGVLTRDISRVKKAFERGASADALHSYRFGGSWVAGGGHSKDPVLITAIRRSSLEIVEEILKHHPDPKLRRWCSQDGVKGYLKKDLLLEAEEQATLRAREDGQAMKKLDAIKSYVSVPIKKSAAVKL